MADGSTNSTNAQISTIVRDILAKRSIETRSGPTDDLRALGLTSLDMVNLMLAVEDEFGIEIPQAEMTPENFRSVASIEQLVKAVVPSV
jgi:acyl carrier protein